jgi:periplasmic divalent cation tolerance protein
MRLILTTVASEADAHRIARTLVQEQLCACAQIEAIASVYRWDGQLCEEPEWRLLLKTAEDRAAALQARLHALHPYTLPAVYCLRPESVSAPFARWVEAQTR